MTSLIMLCLFVGLIACFIWVFVRPHISTTILGNPHNEIKYGFKDLKSYFQTKGYNLYSRIGRVWGYCGAFGRGKTLAMVHDARMIYKHYNGKIVFWKGEFRPQIVNVYSNVVINDIPYIRLNSLMDIVDVAKKQPAFDDENHVHTVSIFCIDELSSLLNSRSFATNLNFDVIASLLQCRKASSKLLYTAQNFVEVDALIRRNTHYVVDCRKTWRFMFGMVYDAKELEYAINPTLCKPIEDYGWFVHNSDYEAYDTLSQALEVDKNKISEDFITSEEAYSRLDRVQGTLDNCTRLNHKGSLKQRKRALI